MAKKKTSKKVKKAKVLKKIPSKAQSKKKEKKSAPRTQELRIIVSQQNTPVVPSVSELSEPMLAGKKLSMVKTWVSESQLHRILQNTPKQYIYERPGKGGGKFKYVTGSFMEKSLNLAFGWNWDFEVMSHGREQDFVWVLGKLIVRSPDNKNSITKTQFGRAEIKYLTEFKNNKKVKTDKFLDYGNDLKGAATDSLKKCASLLGFAQDIYGMADYKNETGNEPKDDNVPKIPVDKKNTVSGPDGDPVILCTNCDGIVSEAGADFSKRIYGKVLCRDCAKLVKSLKK